MLKSLFLTKDKEKNKELVSLMKSGLKDLEEEIEEMFQNQIAIEKLDKIVDIIEKTLEFNRRQSQQGQGLKILTSEQVLSRLEIFLAQLKAGKNSEKLKNEIRQLLHSLYHLRKYPKQSINIWLVLFKNRNNIYEHRKS